MNSAFTHSEAMLVILIIVTLFISFVGMYLTTKLISAYYAQPFSIRRRTAFALLTGAMLTTRWALGLYLISGVRSFDPIAYQLVATVNPLGAILYYCVVVRVLRLPAAHSMRLMSHIYLYYMLVLAMSRFVMVHLFIQPPGSYSYLINTYSQFAAFGVIITVYACARLYQRLSGFSINLADKASPNLRLDILLFMVRTTFAYAVAVIVPITMSEAAVAQSLLVILYALLLLLDIQIDLRKAMRLRLENKKAHVNALLSSMEDFSVVKHDFFNILQTYQGYISIGDLDQLKRYHATLERYTLKADNGISLSSRMEEHPELVRVLKEHAEAAECAGVKLYIDIQSDLGSLYISADDQCGVVSCLLDHAIEAAARSALRHVFFSIERKYTDERLITVTNSTASPAPSHHTGWPNQEEKPGLSHARNTALRQILERNMNCSFHTAYYECEFSAYVSIRPPVSGKSNLKTS